MPRQGFRGTCLGRVRKSVPRESALTWAAAVPERPDEDSTRLILHASGDPADRTSTERRFRTMARLSIDLCNSAVLSGNVQANVIDARDRVARNCWRLVIAANYLHGASLIAPRSTLTPARESATSGCPLACLPCAR